MIDPLWLQAFALTLAVEVPLAVALLPRERRARMVLVVASTQAFTHPLAWLSFQRGWLGWWGVEGAVVAVEALVYAVATGSKGRSLLASLGANAASAALGIWCLGP